MSLVAQVRDFDQVQARDLLDLLGFYNRPGLGEFRNGSKDSRRPLNPVRHQKRLKQRMILARDILE
jgi:hypothetical protein